MKKRISYNKFVELVVQGTTPTVSWKHIERLAHESLKLRILQKEQKLIEARLSYANYKNSQLISENVELLNQITAMQRPRAKEQER